MKGAVRFKGRKPSKNQTFRRLRGPGVLVASCLITAGMILLVLVRGGIASPVLHQMGLSPAAKSGSSVADTSKAIGKKGNIATIQAPRGIDAGNALIAQSTGTSAGGAVYDPMQRIVKIVETTSGSVTSTKQFVWDEDQLCEERDGSGNVTKRFFDYGQQNGSTNYFYNRDHLGSVREMTDSSGNVAAQYSYDAYGRMSKLAGSVDSDMQYAGMYKHERSGLSLAVNRQYNPTMGRWLSRDPISDPTFFLMHQTTSTELGQPESAIVPSGPRPLVAASNPVRLTERFHSKGRPLAANEYVYVANNPTNMKDPSGLRGIFPDPDPRPCLEAWPDVWFHCAAKCSAQCALVKNTWYCFKDCYLKCTHGL